MAKKKKHRKTRKQKMASTNQGSSASKTLSSQSIAEVPAAAIKPSKKPIPNVPEHKQENRLEDHPYVKSDVTRSMVLLGVILLAFAAIYILFNYTSLGSQVYSTIKL
jgi:hypothetical protein